MHVRLVKIIIFDGTHIKIKPTDVLLLGLNLKTAGVISNLEKANNVERSCTSVTTLDFANLNAHDVAIIMNPNYVGVQSQKLRELLIGYLTKGVIGIYIPAVHFEYKSAHFNNCVSFVQSMIKFSQELQIKTPNIIFGSDTKSVDLKKVFPSQTHFFEIHKNMKEFCFELFSCIQLRNKTHSH
jgi:hypothetical protein